MHIVTGIRTGLTPVTPSPTDSTFKTISLILVLVYFTYNSTAFVTQNNGESTFRILSTARVLVAVQTSSLLIERSNNIYSRMADTSV